MDRKEILSKIVQKKEFSRLPKKDIELVFSHFEKRQTSDEEKIKLSRDLLRKVYSVFTSGKLLNQKILDKKNSEDVLKKHISTKERFDFYKELYKKLLVNSKRVSIIDLGAGVNGLSYDFFPSKIKYVGVEAVGQLVDLNNFYFKKNNLDGIAIHESLFNLEKIKKIINDTERPRIIFLFKVIDSLEMIEKNYSKQLLKEIVPFVDKVIVSFATKSLIKKTKFKVKRFWFENFVHENFLFLDDFEIGGERYIVFKKR